MTDIFISYARSTADQAHKVAEALRALGYGVWRDDELPAHRAYAEVIEERLAAAKAVVVIWSAEAVKSQWVFSEANRAREGSKLVQLSLDATRLPMPFDSLQCADMAGWDGDTNAPGWRKVVASLGDLIGAVRSPAVEAPALALPSKPSIAVMPFANLSNDPEQDYFADGMVEEIVGALSRFKSIFVIASGSTLTLKGKAVTPQEVSRLLGVRYILEGSVRRAGGRVRIAVKLIDATDGSQIWSERFDDTLEDVFALQDKVALSVAGVIEPTVQLAETRRGSSRPTSNLGSYDLSLRARASWRAFSKPALVAALEHLHRAIELDPEFGSALGFAAWCHGWLLIAGWSENPGVDRNQAVELARRALEVASDDAEVLTFVADALAMTGGNHAASLDLVERALSLNPGHAFAYHLSCIYLMLAGQADEAVSREETSMRLNPAADYRGAQICWLGAGKMFKRDYEGALIHLNQAFQLMPGYVWTHFFLAICHGHLGQLEQARAVMSQLGSVAVMPPQGIASAFRDPEHRKILLEGIALVEGAG